MDKEKMERRADRVLRRLAEMPGTWIVLAIIAGILVLAVLL